MVFKTVNYLFIDTVYFQFYLVVKEVVRCKYFLKQRDFETLLRLWIYYGPGYVGMTLGDDDPVLAEMMKIKGFLWWWA